MTLRYIVEVEDGDVDTIDAITDALSSKFINAFIYEIDENGEPVG